MIKIRLENPKGELIRQGEAEIDPDSNFLVWERRLFQRYKVTTPARGQIFNFQYTHFPLIEGAKVYRELPCPCLPDNWGA